MKSLLESKKGQLGMDVAKSFMLGLMTLLVLGVTVLIVLNSLGDTSIALDSYSVTNETSGYINATGYTLDQASLSGFTNPVITALFNATDNTTIGLGNVSTTSAGVMTNATTTNWVDVLVSYTYDADGNVASVVNNGSSSVVDFFSNTATWLALLGVVIIILIIAVVITVVNRFGGGRTSV